MIPPPARSNHPSFSRHLHPLVQPASCIALFVGPSLLSVPAPTSPVPVHDSFPSDAVTGVAPAPNSYKIDGQEPHRRRGEGWVTPAGSLSCSASSFLCSFQPLDRGASQSFIYTRIRIMPGVCVRETVWQFVGDGTEQKRNGETTSSTLLTLDRGWLIKRNKERNNQRIG